MFLSRKTIPYFLLCIVLSLQLGCSNQEKTAADHFSRGEAYFDKGDFKSAIIEYSNVVKIMPKDAKAQYKLGLAYVETNEPSRALKHLLRAASLDSTNIDANLKVAEIFIAANELQDAQKYIDTLLTHAPGNREGLILRARVLAADNRLDDGLKVVDDVLAQDGKNGAALQLKARLFVAKKQYEEAEDVLRKAISIDVKNIDLHKMLVSLFFLEGAPDKADVHLAEMVALFPDSLEAKLGLVFIKVRNKQFSDAERLIDDALKSNLKNEQLYRVAYRFYRYTEQLGKAEHILKTGLDQLPDKKLFKVLLADFYFETADKEKSHHLVDEVLAEDNGYSPAKLVQAKLFLGEGKLHQAQDIVEALMKDRPKWSEPYVVLSLILNQQGMYNTALQAAEKAVHLGPGDPKAHHQLALLYLQGNKFKIGEQEAIKALQLQPGNWHVYFTFAQCLAGEKEYEKAMAILSELHERKPENAEILLLRGDCAKALGKPDMARSDYAQALQIEPNLTPALARLVKLEQTNGSDFAQARKIIEQQIVKSGNFAGHVFLLAGFLVENKKYNDAIGVLKTLNETNPKFIEAYNLLARIYLLQGNREKAISEFRSSLTVDPKGIGTMMNLALLLGQAGKVEDARQLYEKIIGIDPGFAPAANGLAMYHSREGGDLGLALYYARSARERAPNDPFVADTLGWVYYKRGSYELALTELQRAGKALPGNKEIKEHLALAEKAYASQKRDAEKTHQKEIDFGGTLSIGNIKGKDLEQFSK